MIQRRLERLLAQHCTLLGIGPVSQNCIDATIELANEYYVPLMLIASRRQIDSDDFGGGYVNGWNTIQFAEYVIDNDKEGRVILARDHGGPWQNPVEKENNLSLRRAMESAKASFKADIDAGFQILHIDPSIDIHSKPQRDEILDRVFELYEFCWSYSQNVGRNILFEIGTEEQSGSTNSQEELNYTLSSIKKFCNTNKIPSPFFVVTQTGTRVMEMRNIGSFDSPLRIVDEIPPEIQIPKIVEICGRYGILMKSHNTDYLSDESLQWHPRLGIHSANVAPEFGVAETRALVRVLEENDCSDLSDLFLNIAYDSNKWSKWMLPGTKASDRDRAVIAGHYVFAHPEVTEIKSEGKKRLFKKGIELDRYLKTEVKKSIFRYLHNFRLVRSI